MKAVILEFQEGSVALPVQEIARVLRPEEVEDLKQNGVEFTSLAELFSWKVPEDATHDGLLIPDASGMPKAFGGLMVKGIVDVSEKGATPLPPFIFHSAELSAKVLAGEEPIYLFSCPSLIGASQ